MGSKSCLLIKINRLVFKQADLTPKYKDWTAKLENKNKKIRK